MCAYFRQLGRGVFVILGMLWITAPASGQTNASVSFGANLGSLTYQTTSTPRQCVSAYGPVSYTYVTYSNFNYIAGDNTSYPIPGSTYSDIGVGGRYVGSGNCPIYPLGPNISYVGNTYTITITALGPGHPHLAQIVVQGYINPKYLVLGLYYAPPGHSSSVDYTNSTLVSSTTTTKDSYSNSYSITQGESFSYGSPIKGYKDSKIDGGASTSSTYTQSSTTTDSTAVTVQKTTSLAFKVPGPVCDYCGVDHDYDQIAVWLNPVAIFTLTSIGVSSGGSVIIQSNGYGFSTWDQPGIDVYYVYAGELNGDLPIRPATATAFARSWANSTAFIWPTGDGPGLTASDEQNILKLDPYWNCTYKSPVSDSTDCSNPPNSTLYTQTLNASFPYQQPEPGIGPDNTDYKWTYTNTDMVGTTVSQTLSQTFSLEQTFGVSVFGLGYQESLKQAWTTATTYETSSQFTSSNTSSAEASITGPTCSVQNGACNPIYPPSNAYYPVNCTPLQLPTAFGQGNNMYIYQDNLFGTFLFAPYGQ